MVNQSIEFGLKVKIVEYVDDSQPGWVRCTFTDAYGIEWSVIDKVPIVTDEYLDEKSNYPKNGILSCVIIDESSTANDVTKIDTSKPIFIEAENGEHEFFVFKNQLTDYNEWTSKSSV
ncbi:MAG: hypothetical protein KIT80_12065 [Chitinophagaceae bacterium]|nr:hypothetical protein [Chitinophagaceae bacterium]MCW5927638.1 hypothetical protein [Chitinophagaceae bacterium]